MNGKIVSIVACMAIAILLLSNVSNVVHAESDLAMTENIAGEDFDSISETDLIYYSALGAGSATVGGIIGAFTYMELYNKLLGAQLLGGVGTEVRLWTLPFSACTGILGGITAAGIIFVIGYGIYQAVSG